MKRITPKDFYLDLPCSVVSIGCASETLHGSFDYGKIKAFSEIASANNNYETARLIDNQTMFISNMNNTNQLAVINGFNQLQQQIADAQEGYVVKDDIEYGSDNIIPLWAFGLTY